LAQRSLSPALRADRSEYLVERDMSRLQGRPWSLTPPYLERGDHVTGLIRRLSVGWRVRTRLACGVRQRLTAERTGLAGWYADNPTRPTARPTTALLLKRSQGVTLTILREGRRWRSPLTLLSRMPRRLLALLNVPVNISTRRGPDAHQPPFNGRTVSI
jgi:transposase